MDLICTLGRLLRIINDFFAPLLDTHRRAAVGLCQAAVPAPGRPVSPAARCPPNEGRQPWGA
eukprot:scaffold200229_cov32-Prasinocladus_malaysianus.AAC.1